jgi:serine/threonine protein kinase
LPVGSNDHELFESIKKERFDVPEYISQKLRKLMGQILQGNESKRPTAAELMKSEWLGQFDPPNNLSLFTSKLSK